MRIVRIVFKGIGVIFLLWLAMHAWNILSPLFLPGPAVQPGSSAGLQQALEGLAKAQQAGPEAEQAYREQLDRSHPFDNSLVIYYMFPLVLVWLLCAAGKARRLSPLAVVGALALLWLAGLVAVRTVVLVAPHAGTIGSYIIEVFSYASEMTTWKAVGLAITVAALLVWRAPGFMLSVPRRFERALIELLNDEDGWVAQRYGSNTARAGHGAVIFLLAGVAAWVMWRACDGLDGAGIPDAFALVARSGAVAFGAFLLARTHLLDTS